MNTKNLTTAFKIVSFVEALTWIALLTASVLKRVLHDDSLIFWPGMIHGIVFVVLVALVLTVGRVLAWDTKTVVVGLIASVLPFCSVVFEVWAQRAGKLDAPSAAAKATEPADAIGG